MAKLMVYPRFKAFDSDGTALASGTVNTYVTGTSTPKATYTDSTEGTPNANPVVLDSNGEADIWLLTDAAYKFVIKDSLGTTLHTIDPIVPISNLTTLENDLDTNGQSIISSGANDLDINPASGRNIILDGLKWPTSDGTNGQTLTTNGAGVLSFATASADLLNDTSPQLGGDLDTNSRYITFDTSHGIQDENGNEQLYFTTTASAINYLNITNAATSNAPVIESKGTDSNIGMSLSPKGTGALVLDGLTWPTSDGTSGQVLSTDGAGTISFASTGKFVQKVTTTDATVNTVTTQIALDNTIPQNTEGDEIMTLAITPAATDNRLLIKALIPNVGVSADTVAIMALFQDSTANALAVVAARHEYSHSSPLYLEHEMAAGTVSATTFKIRVGPSSADTIYTLADSAGTRYFGGVAKMVITIEEYST